MRAACSVADCIVILTMEFFKDFLRTDYQVNNSVLPGSGANMYDLFPQPGKRGDEDM